jgi:hypothetical protein
LLERVRASYRRQAAAGNWALINGEAPKDDVTQAVEAAVLSLLAQR